MSNRPMPYSPDDAKRMLGTGQRGLTVILGEDIPPLRFDDGKTQSGKHVLTFDLNDPIKKLQYETAVKSAAFDRGEVVYIESPEELKKKAKKAEQEKTLNDVTKLIKTGVFSVAQLSKKHIDSLTEFADSIGAEYNYYNPKNKTMTLHKKATILSNVYEKLGIDVEEHEKSPPKNEKDLEQEKDKSP